MTRAPATPFTATSAITIAIVALALTACGPRDTAETTPLAGGVAATVPATTVQPVPAMTPPTEPPPGQGAVLGNAGAAGTGSAGGATVPRAPTTVAQAPTYPAPQATRVAPAPVQVQKQAVEPSQVDRNNIGAVESIEPIRERPKGTGAGAVIGGVLGAVVGNQFGHSTGRAAMTGLGAIGGAVAGNNIERNQREGITGYRVNIRLDNGATRTYERTEVGNLRVGDRVRLDASSFHRV